MTKTFEDDLVLKEDKNFEKSIKVHGNIRCKNGRHNLTVKGDIDAENINAGNIDAGNIDADNIDADNIEAENINAGNIDAWDIDADNIDADNIDALNIEAWNIDALNIDAGNIDAWDIDAGNIDAMNIDAMDIDARDISFFAHCIALKSLKCRSIKGRRNNSLYECLDQEIEYKEKEEPETCDCCGQKIKEEEEA